MMLGQLRRYTAPAICLIGMSVVGAPTLSQAEAQWPDLLGDDATAYAEVQSVEVVGSEGYLLKYRITTADGAEDVVGSALARQRLREAAALPKLRDIGGTSAYATGLKETVTGPFEFVGNMATSPLETTGNIGRGLHRLFKGTAIAVPNPGTDREGTDLEALLTVLAYKRDYAAEVGVDTYSSNDAIQAELDRLGRHGAAGNLTLKIATLPVSAAGVTAMSAANFTNSVHDFVYQQAPAEVRRVSLKTLDEVGVARSLSEQFVFHPEFTPLHQTIIVTALRALDGVENRSAFIEAAVTAYDEPTAIFMTEVAQMLVHQHRERARVQRLRAAGSFVVAITGEGRATLPMALDYGDWDNDARAAFDVIAALMDREGAVEREIWLKGMASPAARERAGTRGFLLSENGFADVTWFYPPPLK